MSDSINKAMVANIGRKIVLVDSGLFEIASILYLSAGVNILTGIANPGEAWLMLVASFFWIAAGAAQFYVANAVRICWEKGLTELLNIESKERNPARYYVQERTNYKHPILQLGKNRPKLGSVIFIGSVLTTCLLVTAVWFTISAYSERSLQADSETTTLSKMSATVDGVELQLKRIETYMSQLPKRIDSLFAEHVASRDEGTEIDSLKIRDQKMK